MCDYSLQHVVSRAALVRDRLMTTTFPGSLTRGFSSVDEPGVAVCLLPGTEIAFDQDVECEWALSFIRRRTTGQRLARFRRLDPDQPGVHHDALEFADGRVVLVTKLRSGQAATVLQLPATSTEPPLLDLRPLTTRSDSVDGEPSLAGGSQARVSQIGTSQSWRRS